MPFEDQAKATRSRRYWVKATMIILACFAVLGGTQFVEYSYTEYLLDKEAAKGYRVEGDAIVSYGESPELPPCDLGMDFELSLETLEKTGRANCDFAGWELVLSDVITIEVPPLGDNASTSECPSGQVWGITTFDRGLGIVVYTPTQTWGDPRATALVREAGWLESIDDISC